MQGLRLVVGAYLVSELTEAVRSIRQGSEASSERVIHTDQQCTCTSNCGVTILGGLSCDKCDTKRCGRGLPFFKYDYCVYDPVQSFESKSASEKIEYYEEKIAAHPSTTVEYGDNLEVLERSWTTSVRTSFDNFLPEMPEGREKNIHTVGAVCTVDLNVKDTRWTGLFGKGSQKGFIRLGLAAAPDDEGITPGLGFKFPRSGVPSGDFVAMHNTDGGQPWNFFASNMSNHISPAVFPKTLLAKKFEDATICSSMVGLSHLAAWDQDGTKVSAPKFPYKLFFVPRVSTRNSPTTVAEYVEQFEGFGAGTKLFDVWACASAKDDETPPATDLNQNCGSSSYFGSVTVAKRCTASDYGDRKFHIRHQRIEEDWDLEPRYFEGAQAPCGRSDSDWKAGSPELCPGAHSFMLNSDA